MTSYLTPRTASAVVLTQSALGNQPVIAVPTPFVRLLKDCTAAMFLSQCCYLSEQSTNPDGWFERSHEAWHNDLDLSPEQIRRCVRDCAEMVEVKRMGLPSRNFYRVLPEGISGRLATLQLPAGEVAPDTAPQPSPATRHTQPRKAVASQTPPQAVGTTPRHSSYKEVKRKEEIVKDDVRPATSVSTEALTQLLEVWNEHRADLPEASGLSTARRKALTVLLTDCDGDAQKAVELLTDATKEVASDKFWQDKKFGLDTLLPRVLGKAEAYRSRQTAKIPKETVALPDFGVGQFVLYRRERYAIESITDRYIDLWDEENGSARILINSDDIRAIKPLPLEVRA